MKNKKQKIEIGFCKKHNKHFELFKPFKPFTPKLE